MNRKGCAPLEGFFIAIFIIFVVVQTLADRQRSMKKGQKGRPPAAPPKPQRKPIMQAAPPAPAKTKVSKEKAAPISKPEAKPIMEQMTSPAKAAPPQVMPKARIAERKSIFPAVKNFQMLGEGISSEPIFVEQPSSSERSAGQTNLQPQAVAISQSSYAASNEELRRAVLWSVVLDKPKALRRRNCS